MAAHSTYRLLLLFSLGVLGCAPEVPQGTERARALFATCASCHGEDGRGREAYGAPAIAGLDAWYLRAQLEKFQRGVRGAHPDDVAGLRMRPMSRTPRTPEDVALVSDFVAQLAPREHGHAAPGDAGRGQSLYATCSTCHGPECVRGGMALGLADEQAVRDVVAYIAALGK